MTPTTLFHRSPSSVNFDEASARVVEYLGTVIPMGFWAVTRFDGDRQLYLEVRDSAYGLAAGGCHRWEDSFCINMVAGRTPQIAPDAMAIPDYAAAGVSQQISIGAYIGMPINRADGSLFGTLCGLNPTKMAPDIAAHEPLLQLLTMLLSTILEADLERTQQARKLEDAEQLADTDQLTGLLNRRGWDRHLELEEARYRRFGDSAAVIVIDLDLLKRINDTQGHAAGDRYIRAAGQAIRNIVPQGDVVARLGGDEFGIVATNLADGQCETLVQQIMESFASVGVAGSIGHAPYTVVAGFPGALAEADAAMYAQKRRRRSDTLSSECITTAN